MCNDYGRRSSILIIFIAALAIRLLFNFAFLGTNNASIHSAFHDWDSISYEKTADVLKNDFEYKNFDRAPLFPAFLAVSFTLFGDGPLPVRILLSIIGALTCIIVFLIAEIIFGAKTARVAAYIAIFYIPLFVVNGLLLTETLFTFLSSLVILLFIQYIKKRSGIWLILCGICIALAALTRSEYLLTVILILLMMPIFLRDYQISIRHALMLLVTIILILAPWTLYVSLKQHAIVPISTMGGAVFIGANNPKVIEAPLYEKGRWVRPNETGLLDENYEQELFGKNLASRSSYFYGKSLDWLKNNPQKIPELVFWKEIAFIFSPMSRSWTPSDGKYFYFGLVEALQFFSLFVLFIYGLVKTGLRKQFLLFYVYIFSGILTTAIYWGDIRMRNNLEPIIIIFAAVGILHMKHSINRFRAERRIKVDPSHGEFPESQIVPKLMHDLRDILKPDIPRMTSGPS